MGADCTYLTPAQCFGAITVEPLNNRHFGEESFDCLEVVFLRRYKCMDSTGRG